MPPSKKSHEVRENTAEGDQPFILVHEANNQAAILDHDPHIVEGAIFRPQLDWYKVRRSATCNSVSLSTCRSGIVNLGLVGRLGADHPLASETITDTERSSMNTRAWLGSGGGGTHAPLSQSERRLIQFLQSFFGGLLDRLVRVTCRFLQSGFDLGIVLADFSQNLRRVRPNLGAFVA